MGVNGCKEHMAEAETPANEKKIMQLTIDKSDSMSNLFIQEIQI